MAKLTKQPGFTWSLDSKIREIQEFDVLNRRAVKAETEIRVHEEAARIRMYLGRVIRAFEYMDEDKILGLHGGRNN